MISHNYSTVRVLVALGQILFAITTLYRARGNQIEVYGFTAFGLTVAPYAVMSVINRLRSPCCPDYPLIYLVESLVTDEARSHGRYLNGTAGKLKEFSNTDISTVREDFGGKFYSLQEPLECKDTNSGGIHVRPDDIKAAGLNTLLTNREVTKESGSEEAGQHASQLLRSNNPFKWLKARLPKLLLSPRGPNMNMKLIDKVAMRDLASRSSPSDFQGLTVDEDTHGSGTIPRSPEIELLQQSGYASASPEDLLSDQEALCMPRNG
jgi:hypothetical protein